MNKEELKKLEPGNYILLFHPAYVESGHLMDLVDWAGERGIEIYGIPVHDVDKVKFVKVDQTITMKIEQ